MDVTDSSSSLPWKFHPMGYLVVILANGEEALRAQEALVAGGFDAGTSRSTPACRSSRTNTNTSVVEAS